MQRPLSNPCSQVALTDCLRLILPPSSSFLLSYTHYVAEKVTNYPSFKASPPPRFSSSPSPHSTLLLPWAKEEPTTPDRLFPGVRFYVGVKAEKQKGGTHTKKENRRKSRHGIRYFLPTKLSNFED